MGFPVEIQSKALQLGESLKLPWCKIPVCLGDPQGQKLTEDTCLQTRPRLRTFRYYLKFIIKNFTALIVALEVDVLLACKLFVLKVHSSALITSFQKILT